MPAKSGIGGAAVQLSATATAVLYGVLVKADDANTGTVALGFTSAVTNGTLDATDGIRLYPGACRFVPVAELPNRVLSDIWAIGSASGQRVEYDVDSPGWLTSATGSGGVSAGEAIIGNVAHDAVDSGSPVKIGYKAYDPDTPPAAVQAGDRANGISDLYGRAQLYLASALDQTNDSVRVTKQGAPTDRSGTITSGGTQQTVAAANANRVWFFFQNNSDTACWIDFGVSAVATQPSVLIPANGGYWESSPVFCPTALVSVIGATTGKTFSAKEA